MMGIIGGYEFSVDGDKFTFSGQKMLRTDEQNPVTKNEKGKIVRFKDIPEIEDKDLTPLVDKLIKDSDSIVNKVLMTQAKTYDKFTGEGAIKVYELFKDDPETLNNIVDEVANKVNSVKIGSKASNAIQGTASNSVALRKILTKLGFPKSQAEKEGKGYGQVYTTITGNINELPIEVQNVIKSKQNTQESYIIESKRRILREVRQPLKEIKELPKTTKLKGYKPNFKGKFSPQNTPDVTASKKSDDIVSAKNSSRQVWTAKDKYWKGYETTERMNIIYDNLGFGSQFFDATTGKNAQLKKQQKKRVQEHLNMLAHQKAMREVYGVKEYKNKIAEQETYDNKVKDPLFSKVSDRLNKEIDYPNKPSPLGYPNEAPPKIDPNTGMHPKYGKRYKYDKLDPVSAVMMKRAPTGDPEIDANVKKAAQLKKEHKEIDDQIYEWMLGKLKSDWRKELEEGMTTTNAFSTVLPAEGDTAIDQVSPVDAASFASSDLFFGPGEFGNNSAQAQKSTQIRSSGSGSGSTGGFDVGGDYLAFQGSEGIGDERWAILKPIDATKVDSITITAIRGTGSNGGEHPDVVGTEELYIRYKTPDMNISQYLSFDRSGNAVGSFPADAAIIGINQGDGTLQNYTITIPEYARQKNVTFALYQKGNSGSQYDHYGVTDIKFQRRTPINVVVPLDSPEAISFIRVGTDEGDPKKRKKKVNDQLAASDEYIAQQMGDEFPGQGTRIDGEDPFKSAEIEEPKASPIGKAEVKKSFSDFKNLTDEQKIKQSDEYLADYVKTYDDDTYLDPESLKILDLAIELNPKSLDAFFYRAFAHFDNQNYEDALKDTESVLEIDPDDPDISYIRAVIYLEKGDLELASSEVEKALENYPDWEYLENLKTDIEDQIEQEYRAKQVPPDSNEEGGVVKRQTYYDDVSKKLAPEDTEDQQLVSTNLAQAKDLMTTTHFSFGRDGIYSKGAVDLLKDAYAVEPNNPEILSNLGVALLMNRESFDGERGTYYLERAQAIDPNVEFDFNIKSWDRYDGEEKPAFAGPRIDRLSFLPYRYAREIIKNLPDQSTAKGATHGVTDKDYAKNYGGDVYQYFTDDAKAMTTGRLQSRLISVARQIEDNKYWMNNLGNHPTFKGNLDIIGAPGYVLGATKYTGALNGVTYDDYLREKKKMDNWPTDKSGYYKAGWREQNEKVNKTWYRYQADERIMIVNNQVRRMVEAYKAYYDEYMSRGEPDAIEKVDVPEEGTFADSVQKEIIEKAISEPTKLFKLTAAEEKSYNAALEQTGTNSLGYVAALPFALGTSILTGKPQELFIAPSSAIKIAQDINADELAKVLRIDNPVPVTAREAIEPSEGKTDKVITSLFGKQGGLYFNYDTETKQLYIESRKTLRTTSGGETVDKFRGDLVGDILFQLPNVTGTGTKFTDIPVPSNEQINEIASKIIYKALNQYDVYKDFVDPVVKSGFNPIKIVNVIWDGLRGKIETNDDLRSDAPRTIWDEKSGKMMNNYDYGVAGLKQVFDQNLISDMTTTAASFTVDAGVNAIAANLIALRSILTDIGVPASDIEKFGGAYGMTYSSTPVNYDDLPDDVKAVIDAATGTGIEEPKKDDQGTFDKDGNYYPPGFEPENLIRTDEIETDEGTFRNGTYFPPGFEDATTIDYDNLA